MLLQWLKKKGEYHDHLTVAIRLIALCKDTNLTCKNVRP
jgi:hypothetical protein